MGAALVGTREWGAPAQGSPRRSHRRGGSSEEKQRPIPPRPAIPPPPRYLLPLPSFPPALSPEVERRGAGLRALPGLVGSRSSLWNAPCSPLLRGRADCLPGEQERPVRLAPALASLPPPPPASPAPASAGSRSPPLGKLRTRKQPPHLPAARYQAPSSLNPVRAAVPSGPRGRDAPPGNRALRAGCRDARGGGGLRPPAGGSRAECSRIPAPGDRLGGAFPTGACPKGLDKKKGFQAHRQQTPEA